MYYMMTEWTVAEQGAVMGRPFKLEPHGEPQDAQHSSAPNHKTPKTETHYIQEDRHIKHATCAY